MKSRLLFLFIATIFASSMMAQDAPAHYKVVTIVESIVPGGVGRSRIIETKKEGKLDRGDLKEDDVIETKLLNFYSLVGINFKNIASNDVMIAGKINELSALGWKLSFVSTGVESKAGSDDGDGIFITRLIFYQ
ncbi:MAG TPA: hypothetical protein VK622_04670 [Puia sp.]|nr:hypothetical protein [Puia sp.]